MKVTNNTANTMVIGDMAIFAGTTEDVGNWDDVKDSFAVKAFLKAEAISIEKAGKASKDSDERLALYAELDKVNATYDKKASTPDLLIVLEDAKKKAAG